MRNDLKYFLIFLSPIIMASYFIDVFISTNLKKSNQYAEKEYSTWNDLLEGNLNSDVIVYGASRAWRHINPTMISDSLHLSAYNLGIDGHNFWLQYLRHTLLLKNNKKPKLILVSVDMFTFQKREDLYNSEQFLPYMLWNKEIKNATIGYNGFKAMDYEIPLIRYYGKQEAIETAIRSFSGHLSNPVFRIKGYQGREESWNGDFDRAKLTLKNYEVKIDAATVVLFEKFLKECKTQNIKLVFVYSPEYIEGQKFVKNRNEIISIFTRYSKEYHIPFYDYSKDSLSFQKKYFYNSNHLNKTGAELFTGKLIDKLKNTNALQGL
ncbi:hypothetical protein [Flavobacterium psychrotolerans]|uniref:SGNH/GDSL hydrolase family protein n=1 Tax=Flavobacterium psychrotolerans TaxID=2169410 RepID=A0A2U1JFU6_9FLAO|nr:hypothetical protein [Flavobacterium psychrotolerans]PWA04016.1 hypothetical protein DB895_12985 [Flavobacterium psychrotolerans]